MKMIGITDQSYVKCGDGLRKVAITAVICLMLLIIIVYYEIDSASEQRQRKSLLPVLSVVIFANGPCLDTNATTGSCLSRSSCTLQGGNISASTCASGYGVCCTFLLTCGATLRQNNSYFVNPGYPNSNSTERSCVVQVEKLNDNVVQLRLDFEDMTINGVTNRACEQDVFQVFGQDANSVVPSICGNNVGQHVYVDVGTVRGPIMLSTTTSGSGDRRWKVRVTQIERTNPARAPSGCLQYFTGTTGNVRSFNFNSNVVSGQSNFLRNLNYASCVRRENGYCGIQYTAPAGSFSLSGPAQVSADTACANAVDNLYIPTGRFCGGTGATTPFMMASTAAGQFRINFVTGDTLPPGTFRGYNLDYQQNLCTTLNQGR